MRAVSLLSLLSGSMLAISSPQGLKAQGVVEPSSPISESAKQRTQELLSRLPPNVSLQTPDGEPLSLEMLEKVVELLENDPEIKAISNASTASTIQRSIEGSEIVVIGKQARGSVIGDVPFLRSFNAIDIRAYGVATISELIDAIGSEASAAGFGGDQTPILLLNGRRISDVEEIAFFPSEAIERFEIYPEELALQYGFPATNKVVNIVTFENFSQNTLRGLAGGATEGGAGELQGSFQLLRIADQTRYNLNLSARRTGGILESDRDLIQPSGNDFAGGSRSLQPQVVEGSVNAGISGSVSEKAAFSLRAAATAGIFDAFVGAFEGTQATQRLVTKQYSFGAVLSGQLEKWRWITTNSLKLSRISSKIGLELARSELSNADAKSRLADSDLTFNGSLARLDSGPVDATLRIRLAYEALESDSQVADVVDTSQAARKTFGAFANVSLPLLKTGHSSLLPGDASLGFFAGVDAISDRSSGSKVGGSVTWIPFEPIRITLNASSETTPPSLDHLSGPIVITPNVRIFDFRSGETVDVTQVSGGNVNLRNEKSRTFTGSITFKPWATQNLTANGGIAISERKNAISLLPPPIAEVFEAFPQRLSVDEQGRLVRLDVRPINVARLDQKQIYWGVGWTSTIGKSKNDLIFAPIGGGAAALPPNARIIESPPGTPLPPEIENALSRIFFSFRHVFRFENNVSLTDGSRELDLLNGFSLDLLGGLPRHQVDFVAGLFKRGIGVRTNIAWRSSSRFDGTASELIGRTARLEFLFRPKIDVELFLNPQERFRSSDSEWLQGLQITLEANNLLNSRTLVFDEAGNVPLRLQGAYLDPLGRYIRIGVRKVF